MKQTAAHGITLERLRAVVKSRLLSAQRTLVVELAGLHRIQAEIDERQVNVNRLKADMLALQLCLGGDTQGAGLTLSAKDYSHGLVRRYWLDYELQKECYYLDLTFDELTEQQVTVQKAQKRVHGLNCKHDQLDHRSRQHKLLHFRQVERRQDMEAQAAWTWPEAYDEL